MSADPPIDAAEAAALYRYKLIAQAANPRLGPAERGQAAPFLPRHVRSALARS